MTNERIRQLALDQVLELWAKEHDFLQKNPGNEISQTRERKLWKEVEELRKLVLADERKRH